MNGSYLRGELYYTNLGYGVGSEQEGYRRWSSCQNDLQNQHSPTVIVAAITSRKKNDLPSTAP